MKAACLLTALALVGCSSSTPGGGAVDAGLPVATPEAGAQPNGEAGSCIGPGDSCKTTENDCCNGSTCVVDLKDATKAVCATTCLRADQCNSGCCKALVEGREAVCAPATYCASSCAGPGQDCTTSTCCADSVCVVSTVTGTTCAATCTANSQCQAGCCAPLNNAGVRVCSPASFCQ